MEKIIVELGGWQDLLGPYMLTDPYMQSLGTRLMKMQEDELMPSADKIFRAYQLCSPKDVKVVIIGQDPYPQGADGLAFSSDSIRPSLKVIFRALVEDGFTPMRTDPDLTDWAEQGVLLLNTSLTTQKGIIGAHVNWGWSALIGQTLEKIGGLTQPIAFMLWGNHAKEVASKHVQSPYNFKRMISASCHPQAMNYNDGHDFYRRHHFSTVNNWLTINGSTPIEWNGKRDSLQAGAGNTGVHHAFPGPFQPGAAVRADKDLSSQN